MSNVLISIASEFDSKGFKQADKGFAALTKTATKFIGTLALAKRAQQAVFDAMADEKSSKILAQNLKNLGMAYARIPSEQFIKQMQKQTGILDDQLRPAYAQLARVTGDMTMTQDLLALAFDVSSGSGQDFESVVNALSQAYVGNTKGLKSLNIGLTQAELKTKSFAEITAILNKEFGGAGAVAVQTYAGQLAILQAAAADASETIGFSLINAMQTVSGSTSVTELADKINNVAEALGWMTEKASLGIRAILIFGGAAQNPKQALKDFKQLLSDAQDMQARWAQRNMKVWYPEGYETPAMKQAKKLAIKRQQELLNLQKKTTVEKQKQAALDKAMAAANKALGGANNVFDLERVSVAAALANQTLNENEKKRLEIKQAIFALEDAIDSKDTERITKQTAILNGLLGQFATMQAQDKLLGQIKLAFDSLGMNKDLINLKNLQEALDLLTRMAAINIGGNTTGTVKNNSGIAYNPPKPEDKPDGVTTEDWNKIIGDYNNAFNEEVVVPPPPSTTSSNSNIISIFAKAEKDRLNALSIQQAQYAAQAAGLAAKYGGYVTVNIAGDLQKLIDSITYETQNASANGTPISLDRNATNLAW